MIGTGIVIFTGIALLLAKLKREWLLRALHHDMALDVAVTAITLIVHWGTFSGVMAATVAGLLTSICTTVTKKLIGYIHRGQYYPGLWTMAV